MICPPRDDIDRLLNLLEVIAESVDQMTDEEVLAELEEERGQTPPSFSRSWLWSSGDR